MVVEEQTPPRVKTAYFCHIFIRQGEIEDIDVLLHSLDVSRFRYYNHIALQQPAECDLCHAFTVFLTYGREYVIRKEIIATFGKRSPCHHVSAEFFHILLSLGLLVENMCLDLVNRRCNLHVTGQVYEMVGIEIAYANRPEFSFLISSLNARYAPYRSQNGW